MPRTLRVDFPGAVHHVYGRGNRGQAIFRDEQDHQTFLRRLAYYQGQTGIKVLAYCLMVNHYHLVAVTGDKPLEAFMQRLLVSYTRIFNDKWRLVGHVFQGRNEERLCETDADLMSAISYVHLNPVEAGLVAAAGDWPYSGHRGIIAGHDPIVDVERVIGLFGGSGEYEEFLARPKVKYERRTLAEIAQELGADESVLREKARDAGLVSLRRELAAKGIAEGHRPSEIARFLGRTPAAITHLLGGRDTKRSDLTPLLSKSKV
jgi:putative transposase